MDLRWGWELALALVSELVLVWEWELVLVSELESVLVSVLASASGQKYYQPVPR